MPNNQSQENLTVSQGNVFVETKLRLPERNQRRRIRRRDTYPRAIEERQTQNLVKRKRFFTSVGHSSFDSNGLISISDGSGLQLNINITDANNALWLFVPEVSVFVDAVANSNVWPEGSFFNSSSSRQDPDSYIINSFIQQFTSTDAIVRWRVRITNNSGGAVNIGATLGGRFITNAAEAPG